MKLAVSNIAWSKDEEEDVAHLLQSLGVKYIEVAPTKQWADPTTAPGEELEEYRAFWQGYGLEIVAFQSMLFNRPDLKIFDSEENCRQTLSYLEDFLGIAGTLGVSALVFGSPKNRQRGLLSDKDAEVIAMSFFDALGTRAQKEHTCFCIEPNPTAYACDFVTNAQQGISLVGAVNNPGFRLHLDIAGMTLAGDDIEKSIHDAASLLQHFHISSPNLEQVEDREDVAHRKAAQALRDIRYDNFVSIEMRPGNPGKNLTRVEKAVRFAQATYSS